MERAGDGNGTIDFDALPEHSIANILSFTSPVDACRMSLVSKIFLSAADSDTVWDCFLPCDSLSLISQFPWSSFPSKKALYLALSDRPIIIDQGLKSFQLERRGGKKCYMLSARDLCIIGGDIPQHWQWTRLPDSRFQQVAELLELCLLEIHGKIKTNRLSSNTLYGAYLVYKMVEAYGFETHPVELSVGIYGGDSFSKKVCLDPNIEESSLEPRFWGLERPKDRRDGWLEIEMGELMNSNSGVEDEQVEMSLMEVMGGYWKHGLIVEGIEVRPKQLN